MGIRIYSNSFSNPEYYSYSYSLKVDSTNNIRIRIRVKIIIRDNTDIDLWRRHCDNIILSIEFWQHHYIHKAALYEWTFEFLFAFLNE